MNKTLLAGLFLLAGAGVAQAADVEPAPAADWSGFYVGVNGGFGGGKFDYPMNLTTGDVSGSFLDDLDYDFGADLTASGFFGGVQAGWNWQAGDMVFGAEGDIAWSDIKSELEIYSDTADASISGGSTVDWFGTARLRAGLLATPSLLVYATGGLAWGSVTADYDLDFNGLFQASDDTSKNHMGWTVGGGVEYAITDNLSLKTEYLYVDLGKKELLDLDPDLGGPASFTIDQDIRFHTVKAGLNLRF